MRAKIKEITIFEKPRKKEKECILKMHLRIKEAGKRNIKVKVKGDSKWLQKIYTAQIISTE